MHEIQDSRALSEDRRARREALRLGDAGRVIQYQAYLRRVGKTDHVRKVQTTLSRGNAHTLDTLVDQRPAAARSVLKRCFDVVAATLSLFVLLPGIAAVAVAIRLTSPGTILFRQLRYGLNNRMFVIYKFRTMYSEDADLTGVKQTRQGDERVTPIGKVLRRCSLDEIPQLINIVKGDMSLVGPRPHVPGMLAAGIPYDTLVPEYFERHCVKPGLTGLAQVRGLRGSTADADLAKARVNSDLEYIRSWSFTLDMRIVIETAWREFLKGGNGV